MARGDRHRLLGMQEAADDRSAIVERGRSRGMMALERIGPDDLGPRFAHETICLHNVSMPNVLVRDLPDEVHAELQRRAEARGQSLQQYLAAELTRLTGTPPLDEVLERISKRRGGRVGLEQAVADLDAERAAR